MKLKDVMTMMGKHHARIGLTSGLTAVVVGSALHKSGWVPEVVSDAVYGWAVGQHPTSATQWCVTVLWICAAAFALLIGSYAPDVDSKDSTLGRLFYIPVRHRGWTHTDWFVLAIFAFTLVDPTHLSPWFMFGVITHDVLDEMSVAGRVHFYPLGRYKVVTPSSKLGGRKGEVVVSAKYRGFYTTGHDSTSELITYRVIMSVLVAVMILSIFLVSGTGGLKHTYLPE